MTDILVVYCFLSTEMDGRVVDDLEQIPFKESRHFGAAVMNSNVVVFLLDEFIGLVTYLSTLKSDFVRVGDFNI